MPPPEHPYQTDESQTAYAPEAPPEWQQPPPASHPGYQPHAQQAWNSPVGQQSPAWYPPHQGQQKSKAWLWALLGAFGAVALAIGGYMLFKTGADPLRTLEEFPIESYLRNHEAVLGSRFRAELILDADLGGELGKGRMFSFRSQSTGRILPVLIPDSIGQSVFDKGQRYQLELEVRTGGIIYANSCKKS
jgi:hypothetical protein